MKSKRVTVVMDVDLVQKLRKIQAKQLTNTDKSVSFSQVLNEILRKSLK